MKKNEGECKHLAILTHKCWEFCVCLPLQGIGRLLLTELIDECTKLGYKQMVAVIGDSKNSASIGLHQSMGFKLVTQKSSTVLKCCT